MALSLSKRKRPRLEDKQVAQKSKTEEEVFDRPTFLSLSKMIEKGIFDTLDYPICTGKEANVFRARSKDGFVAVKIYRTTAPVLKRMHKYMEGDTRFKGIMHNKFEVMKAWARKEYRNLELMRAAGCRVPFPIYCDRNILVMEFLGHEGVPYSTLKDTGSLNPQEDSNLILKDIAKLHAAGIVHADISEFNILMDDRGPYLIDVGQAVLLTHPQAEDFLLHDVENLVKYFSHHGVDADIGECLKKIRKV
ncbi:serine protein kinase RIO [Candidatus Micrarchaeota archaeon]|nr:serine protein kinase RIO [Candidatus Micrarchaeota archaeon]